MEGGDGTYSIYQWWSRRTHPSNTWRSKGARKLGEEVVYITGELFADRISQASLRSDSEGSFFFNHFSFLKNSIFAVLSYVGVLFGGKFRVALFCSGLIE
jgi:hypothetical protein